MLKELLLIENPTGRKGSNPVYIAPYSYHKPSIRKRVYVPGYVKRLPGERNPRGGVMKSRNPVSVGALKREWFAGLDMMDMGAALGGLASSTMLPGMIVKDTDGTKKFLKVILAFAAAAGAGFVFRNVSPAAGKYAVAGGVAGALAQVLSTFTSVKLVPSIGQSRLLPAPRFSRGIGESRAAAFSVEEVGQGSVT